MNRYRTVICEGAGHEQLGAGILCFHWPSRLRGRRSKRSMLPQCRQTMPDGLVGGRELVQGAANHLRLDFHLVEAFALVDARYLLSHSKQDVYSSRCVLTTWGFSRATPPT